MVRGLAMCLALGVCSAALWAEPLVLPLDKLKEEIKAQAVILEDAATGEILFQKKTRTPYPPASTVKLMTGLLVYEHTGLKGDIIISKKDTWVEPSHVPLRPGEKVSVSDMVHTLLIGSDNDSAMALARHVAGSVPKFVRLMNLRAKQLGCTNTTFANPHGLPVKGRHVITAHDLMLVFKKTLEIPKFRKIMSTKYFQLRTRVGSQRVKNHNKLLGKYEGMGPAKTGWTYASKHTYAASATRDGRELLLVLLKSPNKWKDARALFDYGFDHLPPLPKKSRKVASIASKKKPTHFPIPSSSPPAASQTKQPSSSDSPSQKQEPQPPLPDPPQKKQEPKEEKPP